MESPEPEALTQVAVIVAGAGLAGTVQGLVKGFVPTLAPEYSGAIAGGLGYYLAKDHPTVRALCVGIIAGSLSPMLQKMVGGVLKTGGSSGGSSSSGGSNPNDAEKAALAYVARSR